MAIYGDYVNSILTNIHILLPFHDDRFTSLRLLNYIGRQRADAEMVNIFVSGGKKYLKQKVTEYTYNGKKYPMKRLSTKKEDQGRGRKKKGKRRFQLFQQDDIIPLIALGDAAFPSTMKGTIPGLARRLHKLLKTEEYQGLLVAVPVAEYMTSRVSNEQSSVY